MMKVAGIVIAIALATYLGVSAYVAINAMKIPRIPLGDSPPPIYNNNGKSPLTRYVPALQHYAVNTASKGNIFIDQTNGSWRNRVDHNVGTLELTRDLVESGYSVLLFDLRGRGESGGEGLAFTYTERDIGGAVDYIKSTGCPTDSIGIIGFSSGAASSLVFASQESIGALVLDGCFADVNKMIIREAPKRRVPQFIARSFTPGLFLMAKIIYGYKAVSPVERAGDVTCPILFIHGKVDGSVPVTDVHKL